MFSVTLAFMMVSYETSKIKMHIFYIVNAVRRATHKYGDSVQF